MAISSVERRHLKKLVKELEKYRGRHTELVTVYIPQGYDLNKVNTHLSQEQGTAENIKSSSTRKNVIDALERMIQHLRLFKHTPPNGLCVFSGNVAEREGVSDVKVWSIEPPVPLKVRIYRCDKAFVLDPLMDMMDIKEVYGLVVMDRRDANLALLKGKTIIPLAKTHSEVPGKFKAGGQCLVKNSYIKIKANNSIKRITIEKIFNSLTKINDNEVKNKKYHCYCLKDSVVGLSLFKFITRRKLRKNESVFTIKFNNNSCVSVTGLHPILTSINKTFKYVQAKNLRKNIECVFYSTIKKCLMTSSVKSVYKLKYNDFVYDITNTPESPNFMLDNGLIVHNSAQRFARLREGAAKDHYKKVGDYMKEQFLPLLNNLKGILVGGPGPTKYDFVDGDFITGDLKKRIIAIKDLSYTEEFGLNELVEKSEDILAQEEVMQEKLLMQRFFRLLNTNINMVAYGKADCEQKLEMSAVDILLVSESLGDEEIDRLEQKCQEFGTNIFLVSVETREGVQLRDIGGLAAILRYEIRQS